MEDLLDRSTLRRARVALDGALHLVIERHARAAGPAPAAQARA
jgi:hypothetical protein